jgi:hypothetical protein
MPAMLLLGHFAGMVLGAPRSYKGGGQNLIMANKKAMHPLSAA